MEQGTIVKLSQAGLDWIYPVHNGWRRAAKKGRWEFRKISADGSACLKKLKSDSYRYFSPRFIEPA